MNAGGGNAILPGSSEHAYGRNTAFGTPNLGTPSCRTTSSTSSRIRLTAKKYQVAKSILSQTSGGHSGGIMPDAFAKPNQKPSSLYSPRCLYNQRQWK